MCIFTQALDGLFNTCVKALDAFRWFSPITCFPNQNYSALKILPIEAKKLLGSAEKNRVGRVTGTRTIFLFGLTSIEPDFTDFHTFARR